MMNDLPLIFCICYTKSESSFEIMNCLINTSYVHTQNQEVRQKTCYILKSRIGSNFTCT